MPRSRSGSKRGLIVKLVSIWALGLGTLLLGAYLLYTAFQEPPPSGSSPRPVPAVGTASDSSPGPAGNHRGPRNRIGSSGHSQSPSGSGSRPSGQPTAPSRSSPGVRSSVVKSLRGDGPKTLILHVHEPGWGIRWKAEAWYFSVHVREDKSSRVLDLIGPIYDEETRGTRYYESTGVIRVKVQAMGDWTVDIIRKP